jgi:hypothetical protein
MRKNENAQHLLRFLAPVGAVLNFKHKFESAGIIDPEGSENIYQD